MGREFEFGPLEWPVGFHFPFPSGGKPTTRKPPPNKPVKPKPPPPVATQRIGFLTFIAQITPIHEYNSYFGIQERWATQDLYLTFGGSASNNRRADPNTMDNDNSSGTAGIGLLPTVSEYLSHLSAGTAFGTQTSTALNLSTGYMFNLGDIAKVPAIGPTMELLLYPTIFETGKQAEIITSITCRFRVWEGPITDIAPGIFSQFTQDGSGNLVGVPSLPPVVDISRTGTLQSRVGSSYPGTTLPWTLSYNFSTKATSMVVSF